MATFEYPRGIEAWAVTGTPSSGSLSRVWIADFGAQTIRVVHGEHVRTVVGAYGQKGSRDGLATPFTDGTAATSVTRSQGGEKALLSNPFHVVLLRTRPLLFIFEKDAPRICMLDLDRWTVSTLHLSAGAPNLSPGSSIFLPASPSFSAFPTDHLSLHFIDLGSESSIFKVSIATGDVQMVSQSSSFENRGYFLPIISPDDSVAMASSSDGFSHSAIQINGTTVFTAPTHISDFRMALAYLPQSNALLYRTKDGRDRLARGFLTHLRLPKRDFSCLLLPPHIASDLTLTNASSGRSWKLHSHVLKSAEGLERSLESLIYVTSNSKLPVSSIEALWRYLYYGTAPSRQGIEASIEMSQVMHLMREIGAAKSGEISNAFVRLVAHLQPEEVSESLIKIWGDVNIEWKEGDEAIQVLKREVKKRSLKEALKKQIPKSGLPPAKVMSLALLFASNATDTSLLTTTDAADRQLSLPAIHFSIEPLASSSSLHSSTATTSPSSSSDQPTLLDFTFIVHGADGQRHVVKSSSIYMYGQWQWFRDLVNHSSEQASVSDSKPSATAATARGAQMHDSICDISAALPWMTLPILCGLLESLHSSFKTELEEEDAWCLCRNAELLKIVDAPMTALAPFEALLTRAMERCLPLLTVENRFVVIKRVHSLGLTLRVDSMIDEILSSPHPPSTLDMEEHLNEALLTRIKARSAVQPS